jgi:hypothetical protein
MHAPGRLQARGPAEENATAHWAPPPLYSVPWQEMRSIPLDRGRKKRRFDVYLTLA